MTASTAIKNLSMKRIMSTLLIFAMCVGLSNVAHSKDGPPKTKMSFAVQQDQVINIAPVAVINYEAFVATVENNVVNYAVVSQESNLTSVVIIPRRPDSPPVPTLYGYSKYLRWDPTPIPINLKLPPSMADAYLQRSRSSSILPAYIKTDHTSVNRPPNMNFG